MKAHDIKRAAADVAAAHMTIQQDVKIVVVVDVADDDAKNVAADDMKAPDSEDDVKKKTVVLAPDAKAPDVKAPDVNAADVKAVDDHSTKAPDDYARAAADVKKAPDNHSLSGAVADV